MNVVQNARIPTPGKRDWLHRAGLQAETNDEWLLDSHFVIDHKNPAADHVALGVDSYGLVGIMQLPAFVRFGTPGEAAFLVAKPKIWHE